MHLTVLDSTSVDFLILAGVVVQVHVLDKVPKYLYFT